MPRKNRTAPQEDPDVQLMLRFREGDRQAFERLFQKHSPSLVNFACHFVGSRARAEEIAQDVFLQVYRWQKRYEPKARFSTWLFKIATNHCLNEVRRGEYRVSVESLDPLVDEEGERQGRGVADMNSSQGEDLLAAREAADKVRKTLARLPANQRAAVVLSRIEGFSYEEVAGTLGCSQQAVKSLIFRATQSLKESLRDLLEPSLPSCLFSPTVPEANNSGITFVQQMDEFACFPTAFFVEEYGV
jgi:RNA polymerase sigma-70 factor (ECF subfamily)